jgi:hypothetical protein
MSVARRGPAALPITCEPASNDRHNSAVQSTLRPGPSSFPLRRNGIMDLAAAQPALSRMLRGGYNEERCGSPAMTLINSTTCGAFGGGRYR